MFMTRAGDLPADTNDALLEEEGSAGMRLFTCSRSFGSPL